MASYTWQFGAQGSGLHFTIVYENGQFTVNSLEGSFDLNALWFAGDSFDGDVHLKGRDNSVNMNGNNVVWSDDGTSSKQKIDWDGVQILSNPGLGKAGTDKDSFISEGESHTFAASPEFDPDDFTTLGVRATSVNGNGGFKFADANSFVSFDVADTFNENVSPDVFFGSGNANGSFTVSQVDEGPHDVELGLRGKLRFNESNQPENTFNSNGDGTYTFEPGKAQPGFGFDPNSPTTPVWNFEWSINTDVNGMSGSNLSDYSFLLEIDGDPTAATDFGSFNFDPINQAYADHAIGNSTGSINKAVAADATTYATLIGTREVAQNSWNYEFFNETTDSLFLEQLQDFDPDDEGTYTIRLSAFDGDDLVNQVSINIVIDDGMMI